MAQWTALPYDNADYRFDHATLLARWARLHQGDAEPAPTDPDVLDAWSHFHAGEFQKAVATGLKAAERGQASGMNAANKAQATYACQLERSEKTRFLLLLEASRRAETLAAQQPGNANAHYLMAYALGRYAQGISVTKALALGLGPKVREALETAIRLQPQHAQAHMALGTFHAEVIDTVGPILGYAQGASREAGLAAFKTALRIDPESAVARIAYANGLAMLEGEPKAKEAEQLYVQASQCTPRDAAERLNVERALAELADDHM